MEDRDLYSSNSENDNDGIKLSELIWIFVKNWKWFVLSVCLCVGIAVLYVKIKNPVYIVRSLVLLKEDEKRPSSSSMIPGMSDLGSIMGSKNIDNEIEIFNTRKIMRQSIIDLNMYVALEVRSNLRKINPYPNLPFIITVDSLQADTIGRLEFTMKPSDNETYNIKGKYYGKKGSTKFSTTIDHFPATIQTSSIDVHIAKNPLVETGKKLKTVDVKIYNPNTLALLLSAKVNAEPIDERTTILNLSTETDNIKWAQDLLDKIIETYNKDAIKDKNMFASLTAQFVDERILKIEEELGSVEKQAENYKKDNNLTDISSHAKLFLTQINDYDKARAETQIQLNIVQYIEECIKSEENQNNLIPTVGISDINLVSIIAKYNAMLTERNRLENATTKSNPALQLINDQLASTRQNILSNIDNFVQSMEIMLKDLKKQDLQTNTKIKNIPRQEREFLEIKRQQEIKATLFSFLLQKKEETSLSLASATPKAKVIEDPMPDIGHIAPRTGLLLMVALCTGMLIPFVIFYLKKSFMIEITSKEEIEALSKVEVIGEICKNEKDGKIVVAHQAKGASVELFRLLRSNLSFVLDSSNKKVILLTSMLSGEGKTYISVNLASSLALINKKVVLVGLDIRKPQLDDYLETPQKNGLTHYLSNRGMKASDIIQHSNIHQNLDIIRAGVIPPNPNELLRSSRLDELMNDLRNLYDYIILDTAPVGLVSDTLLLNRLSDVCLYVIRAGVAHKSSIKYLNTIHEQKKLKNLFVIVNGLDPKKRSSRYGYGYGYGYGYTE
jgi:capsular exopolysaccharide synthesis family protein